MTMVIDVRYGEVASWWFEASRAVDLTASEKQQLRPLLEMVRVAALVLEDHKLLFPENACDHGQRQ